MRRLPVVFPPKCADKSPEGGSTLDRKTGLYLESFPPERGVEPEKGDGNAVLISTAQHFRYNKGRRRGRDILMLAVVAEKTHRYEAERENDLGATKSNWGMKITHS